MSSCARRFLLLLSLVLGTHGFKILWGRSKSHQEITEDAILNVTLQACRSVAEAEGRSFTFPSSVTTKSVLAACAAQESARNFAINKFIIKYSNFLVDIFFVLSSRRHMTDEAIIEGKKVITDGLDALKASIRKGNFFCAKLKLGEILHTLQDFYSHSNWIEMGNDRPNSNLINKVGSVGRIADKNRPTCRSCVKIGRKKDCTNNILQDILDEKILTTGYFSFFPFNKKPAGKCSHGNLLDFTTLFSPKGGINKDDLKSNHGHLHRQAAAVATAASSELLDDVRGAAGDRDFLRMLGISRGKALCFVIDTTGSMGPDIEAVKEATSKIIDERMGTKNEPSVFILVPFNDPDFGPVTRNENANDFMKAVDALYPHGGGAAGGMSLSGLQLALTAAPPGSEIYLFTDAAAKDAHLKTAVTALMQRTGSVVNFVTSFSGSRRRRSKRTGVPLTATESRVYKDLAVASGGQVVEVEKSQVLEATNAMLKTSSINVVTLLQAVRDPGTSEKFTFTVDETVTDLTIYSTGIHEDFTLISPSGESQEGSATAGSLISSRVFVGNLQALTLKAEVGQWEMRVWSVNPYSLKITAQTPIDFFFRFLQLPGVSFDGHFAVENCPKAGAPAIMMVTLLGSTSAILTEVSLVYLSGPGQLNGTVSSLGKGEHLVQFDTIPSQQFNVAVTGQGFNSSTTSSRTSATFQRQSTACFKASTVEVTTSEGNIVIKPNTTLAVSFTVSTSGSGGTFTIRATNDQGFSAVFPGTLEVMSGSSTEGTLQLTAPSDAESGTEVTLTIEAESPDGDVNYVVLSITVLKEVTDVTRPICELLSLQADCSGDCSVSSWQLSVRLSDGANGTGLDRVYLRQGNGSLSTGHTADKNAIATYEASCCSPTVEIIAVDAVGNVGSCTFSGATTTTVTT